MDMIDLEEEIQNDIVTCVAGFSNGGYSVEGDNIDNMITQLCNIVVDRFRDYNREQKRSAKIKNDN